MKAYKFRVLLDNKEDFEIVRDVHIAGSDNFETLHYAILSAFNFQGQEMASFYLSNTSWDKGQELSLFDVGIEEMPDAPLVMAKTEIQQINSFDTNKLLYVYDFLRMWIFYVDFQGEVEIEETELPALGLAIGTAPDEYSKEVDLSGDIFEDEPKKDIDPFDDFNDFEDFNDSFENLDDYDL